MSDRVRRLSPSERHLEPESGAERVRLAACIREALECYAPPSMADAIFVRALATFGAATVPRSSATLRVFVETALVDAARVELGAGTAHAIRERLVPLVDALAAIEREAGASLAPETQHRIELAMLSARLVIAIGVDPLETSALGAALEDRALVQRVARTDELVERLRLVRDEPRALVVDCRAPNPLVPALLSLAPALLDDAVVLLWGASPLEEKTFRARFPACVAGACPRRASPADIATRLRAPDLQGGAGLKGI